MLNSQRRILNYTYRQPSPKRNLLSVQLYCSEKVLLPFHTRASFPTVIKPLDGDLLLSFSYNTRREIRRAMEWDTSYGVPGDKEMEALFNQQAEILGLGKYDRKLISSFGKQKEITGIRYEGKLVAAHIYLKDVRSGTLLLWRSASCRRDCKNELDNGKIGALHRLLHYMDMEKFRDEGFVVYNFGGLTGDAVRDRFKLGFCGGVVEEYHYFPFYYKFLKKCKQRIYQLRDYLRKKRKAYPLFNLSRSFTSRSGGTPCQV